MLCSCSQQFLPRAKVHLPAGGHRQEKDSIACCLLPHCLFRSFPGTASFSQWMVSEVLRQPLGLLSSCLCLPWVSLTTNLPLQQAVARRERGSRSNTSHKSSRPEISHQWPLHHFHSKSFIPTLKSGHCACRIGNGSLVMTGRGYSGHPTSPLLLPTLTCLLSL